MARKTPLMLRVERDHQCLLERLLPELFNKKGLSGAAEDLGVGKATVIYWLRKLDINVRHVVLSPGETIEIRRVTHPSAADLKKRMGGKVVL